MMTAWSYIFTFVAGMATGAFIVRCLMYGVTGGPIRPDGVD